ncbi:MAG: NYN domain-containing protein [Firmicutes bacterium]|nr:NYN domain-containing protein [Bacillota bacterium]
MFSDNIVIGMLAHVDAGKTTMAEAMLYRSGRLRTQGRVDHGDAYLDTDRMEKERGITIFSKQAVFSLGGLSVDLLDTPGHIDFSAEMERTLSVLDYAVLVVSAPAGVQAHTETLWSLLSRYHVPTFIWVNKMDQTVFDRVGIMADLRRRLSAVCVDFTASAGGGEAGAFHEDVAVCDEALMEKYLEGTAPSDDDIVMLIRQRKIFPCWFGSALKLTGVDEFLAGLARFARPREWPEKFAAKVFKITRGESGERLTWLKITGGSLRVRSLIGEEKITQIRRYSGAKFDASDTVEAGCVCAVTGLSAARAGQGLGAERDSMAPQLESVLSYSIGLPDGADVQDAFRKLSALSEEDPMLRIVWNPQLREIQARLMGEVQTEILKQMILDRFGMDVTIGAGRIMYRETIAGPVEGVGHFEPLRHYAEVHLLLEPGEPGSGVVFDSACSTDELDLNWQRLIMGNLSEKTHLGVLTGSPLTDVRVTLVAGRAHLKHTEGGDFRQASWRALRQGLMQAENVLLEPWYDFTLEVPSDQIGRAIADMKAMGAGFGAPYETGRAQGAASETMAVAGRVPASEVQNYQTTLLSYTKGRGRLSCRFAGYFPCHNTAEVVEAAGYDPDRDVENTADSVFCSHGAGVTVKWDHVRDFMHIDSGLRFGPAAAGDGAGSAASCGSGSSVTLAAPKARRTDFDEKELEAIMLKEFGPIKRPRYSTVRYDYDASPRKSAAPTKPQYLVVDGYNAVFTDQALSRLAKESISMARDRLVQMLDNYRAFRGLNLLLVFDGYKVKGNPGTVESVGPAAKSAQGQAPGEQSEFTVVFTKDGETADNYIERFIHEHGRSYDVKVASSDGLIQISALRLGVLRMSARELFADIAAAEEEMRAVLDEGRPRTTLADAARISVTDSSRADG